MFDFKDPLAIKLKLFLTFLIVLIVVPAWRKYILAKATLASWAGRVGNMLGIVLRICILLHGT